MTVSRLVLASPTDETMSPRLSDEVELYQRTYNTLLRSSGETHLRVLESSHRQMGSSLHPLADSDEPDLGALIYAIRRLPDGIAGAELVIMGQEAEVFARNGIVIDDWDEADAPARRRRWHDAGDGTHAVLLASASDVDDLIPTLVAFQIEWNKIRVRERAAGWPPEGKPTPEACAEALGGTPDDWERLRKAWGDRFEERMRLIAERRMNLRVRMLGGTQVGYARMTRRWWNPVHDALAEQGLGDAPMYFVSSNTHSLVNIATGIASEREQALVDFVETLPESDILTEELAAFREGRSEGSWENFLYFVARLYFDSHGEEGREARRRSEQECGVSHLRSTTALRVPAQLIPLSKLVPERLDPRLGEVDAAALAQSEAVVVNIDYPLGLAAYNILREVAVDAAMLKGVYVLGKAATLNADVGDVMLSSVVHDEHSGSTYWLDNAFGVNDLAGRPAFWQRPRQPARRHGQEHVPPEPRVPRLLLPRGVHGGRDGGGALLQRDLRDRRRRPPPGGRGGQLLKAAARLRDHPLRVRYALHPGPNPGSARPVLLRNGLDLRVVAGDPAPDPAARGRARLERRPSWTSSTSGAR